MSKSQPTFAPTTTDTRTMVAVHTVYRREFRLAAGAVRAVEAGDTRRAAIVGDHLTMIGRHLHHHHTTEDRLLWPMLLERVPEELAPIVHLMESQHARVEGLLAQIATLLPDWRSHARVEDREALAALYDALYVHLAEHLDGEEQRLLPLAARCVTQQEWDRLGEEGRSGTPRREQALGFGLIAYEADREVVALMLAKAPAPVRWLVPRLGRRAFTRHARRVHGTSTP